MRSKSSIVKEKTNSIFVTLHTLFPRVLGSIVVVFGLFAVLCIFLFPEVAQALTVSANASPSVVPLGGTFFTS